MVELGFYVLATVLAILSSAFYSGCETGLYCLNPVRLELGRRMRRRPAEMLSHMLRDREGMIATTLVGTNLSNYVATACFVSLLTFAYVSDRKSELVTTLVLTPIIFVFAEVTPKNLFRREADLLMVRLIWPLRISDLLFRATGVIPLLKSLAKLAARLAGFRGGRTLSSVEPRDQITALLREGVGVGVLSDDQSAIVDRVMSLSHVRVQAAMIRRSHVHTVSVDTDRERFMQVARTIRYTRLPVLADGNKAVGIVNVLDVLLDASDQSTPPRAITDYMVPPLFVRPEQGVTVALATMQRRGAPMAVVVDRHDRFLGIVTLKDLVEEIVGDLQAW